MFYVGDGDIERSGKSEGVGPFGGLAGFGMEPCVGVDEISLEPFPSSLEGATDSCIPWKSASNALPGMSIKTS